MDNNTWLDRNRQIIFIFLLVIALGGAGVFYFRQPAQGPVEILPKVEAIATTEPGATPSPTPAPVRVYVTGAVINPDVYFLPFGSIIKDAILAAGGCTPDADLEGINQALQLKDQQQIRVPRLGEENPPPPVQDGTDNMAQEQGSKPVFAEASRININYATLEELDSLPGVGPVIGQRIIDYRENVGGFKTVDEITQVSGIGEATLAKIRDSIIVE